MSEEAIREEERAPETQSDNDDDTWQPLSLGVSKVIKGLIEQVGDNDE